MSSSQAMTSTKGARTLLRLMRQMHSVRRQVKRGRPSQTIIEEIMDGDDESEGGQNLVPIVDNSTLFSGINELYKKVLSLYVKYTMSISQLEAVMNLLRTLGQDIPVKYETLLNKCSFIYQPVIKKYYFAKCFFSGTGIIGPYTNEIIGVCDCGGCSQYKLREIEKEPEGNFFINVSLEDQLKFFWPRLHMHLKTSQSCNQSGMSVMSDGFVFKKHSKEICLKLGIDRMPLSASSTRGATPVFAYVVNINKTVASKCPLLLALHVGLKEPDMNSLLHPIVMELESLGREGMIINDKHITVKVICIIADAPMRSALRSIRNYHGVFGCGECLINTIPLTAETRQDGKSKGRMFPMTTTLTSRTDENFRILANQCWSEPQGIFRKSKLLELPGFDIVRMLPVDYMHCIDLGVVKMLIIAWCNKKFKVKGDKKFFLEKQGIAKVNYRLKKVKPTSNFKRRPRCLEKVTSYKAIELENFLLYYGRTVLKGILKKKFLDHFLLLSDATLLLMGSNVMLKDIEDGQEKLELFVKQMEQLYPASLYTFNVHSLLHLPSAVKRFGPLFSFSAFFSENSLFQMKKTMMTLNQDSAQQLTKKHFVKLSINCLDCYEGYSELEIGKENQPTVEELTLVQSVFPGITEFTMLRRLVYKKSLISVKSNNKVYDDSNISFKINNEKHFLSIKKMVKFPDNRITLVGNQFKVVRSINLSTHLSCYTLHDLVPVNLQNVDNKVIVLREHNGAFVLNEVINRHFI